MNRHKQRVSSEEGFVLFYMAVFLTLLLICVGLAVDTGRAYVVQAQLSKAVDGAALGAARMLNSGNPRQEAANIYRANFPDGWMGTTSSTSPSEAGFFTMTTDATTGVNVVNVRATAIVPTTFMRLANRTELQVNALGEATRRMVDLSLVMDVSSSIGWRWQYVRDAARHFVDAFDARNDRVSLVFFGNGARVVDAMPAGRGFDKARVMADIPNTLPGGSTAMVQGLYRGWDELRSVPNGQQSGLRVIVLFTDGASNSVPGSGQPAPAGTSQWAENVGLPGRHVRRPRQPDAQQSAYRRSLPHATLVPRARRSVLPAVQLGHHTLSPNDSVIRAVQFMPPTCRASTPNTAAAGIPTSFPMSDEHPEGQRRRAVDARATAGLQRGAGRYPGSRLEHQQRREQSGRDHRQRGARRYRRRLSDSHLLDRHGRARALPARHAPGDVGGAS